MVRDVPRTCRQRCAELRAALLRTVSPSRFRGSHNPIELIRLPFGAGQPRAQSTVGLRGSRGPRRLAFRSTRGVRKE